MHNPPIILVPGFWLGAWAWDEVAATLRADGHDVTAITLPGLESADADRSAVTFADHVDAIVRRGRARRRRRSCSSSTARPGSPATPRPTAIPERIAAMVYVDTAPGKGALDPDFEGDEKPMVWAEIQEEENLDGLSEAQLATFRERAVPVPGGLLREGHEFTNDARRDIPSTIIATGFTAEAYQTYAREHPSGRSSPGIPELRNVTWVDLPTSHWPMWSRPGGGRRRSSAASRRPTRPRASSRGRGAFSAGDATRDRWTSRRSLGPGSEAALHDGVGRLERDDQLLCGSRVVRLILPAEPGRRIVRCVSPRGRPPLAASRRPPHRCRRPRGSPGGGPSASMMDERPP